jgi:hypothetical protein
MSEKTSKIIRPFSGDGTFPAPSEGEAPVDLQNEAEIQEAARKLLETKASDERGQKDTALAMAVGVTEETFNNKHQRARAFFVVALGADIRRTMQSYLLKDSENDIPAVTDSDRSILLQALDYDNPVTDEAITLLRNHPVLKPMLESLVQKIKALI